MARTTGVVALIAAVGFAALVVATTAAQRMPGAPTDGRFIVNGTSIHFLIDGRGAPVILVHGLYSSAFINWEIPGLFQELARTRQVIALDLPGHGQSDKPVDGAAYGRALADDVIALMDHLHLARADLVGYSMGGMIVVKLLATHQDRIDSAIVAGMGWLQQGSPLQEAWERAPGRGAGATPPVVAPSLGELAVTAAELKSIRVPTLVVVGDHDPVNVLYVAPLRRVRSDWPVVVIPGAGHLDCVSKPLFHQTIADWLARH